ncbi:MAG: hypothetical protein ACLR5G_11070 [Eubacteriales bacterium]
MENKTRSGRSRLADLVVHIATIAVAAAALAYLGYHFFEGFSADIETEYATLVTDSDVVPLDAYIMRSESVIFAASATSGHSVGYVFSDGTKSSRRAGRREYLHRRRFLGRGDSRPRPADRPA